MTAATATRRRGWRRLITIGAVATLLIAAAPTRVTAQSDPRVGLGPGWQDAQSAIRHLDLVAHLPKPAGFNHPDAPDDPAAIGAINFANTDLAFQGDFVFVGNYQGFNIYDIREPSEPVLITSVICPGGQGDLTVHGDLLFMSVEQTSGRIDCGTEGAPGTVNPERFRGVRVFDISDIRHPVQVAAVQTCRGSHTHTLITDVDDPDHVYIYSSGVSGVRPTAELSRCTNTPGTNNPADYLDENGEPILTSRFMIEVIRVPLAAPHTAEIVNEARVMADPVTGNPHGLWPGGNHGPGTQSTTASHACHDITAFPALKLAAGACQGNGILLDISDPVNPVRIDEVTDPNFAYWHSATFNNDGTKVIFTDEWGGGTAPRCLADDPPSWGANAIFDIVDGKLRFASYYKLPAPQTSFENCVAHNGSLVPVPGRDILVQAWYQGGISLIDFTDSANPVEIAYFDRGPVAERRNAQGSPLITLGGFWSAYYYRGHIYGTEIARGVDVFRLRPSEHLDRAEVEVAASVRQDVFNVQEQPGLTWEPSFTLVWAKYAQALRTDTMSPHTAAKVEATIEKAERFAAGPQRQAAVAQLRNAAKWLDRSVSRQAELADALHALADDLA